MTYEQFKTIMMRIKNGSESIRIEETGPYNNQDARINMGLLIEWLPIEYCRKLLEQARWSSGNQHPGAKQ